MVAHPHPTASDGTSGEGRRRPEPSPADSVVPVAARPSFRVRRRLRSAGREDGRRGMPAMGTSPGEGTPGTRRTEAQYRADVGIVLAQALDVVAPLRLRSAALEKLCELGAVELREAEERRHAADEVSELGRRRRVRAEERLTDAEFDDRVRGEIRREVARLDADISNRRALLVERRAALREIAESFESLVERTLAQADLVRMRRVLELEEYVDELVRHHPDGARLGALTWPTSFTAPPEWARDRAVLCHRLWATQAPGGSDEDR